MGAKTIFWFVVLAMLFYVGFEVVPIFYKGTIGIRGACKENVDLYKKYGRGYVFRGIEESLDSKGITKGKRAFTINLTETNVIIRIQYGDTANFFNRYEKSFDFDYECEGELKSIY